MHRRFITLALAGALIAMLGGPAAASAASPSGQFQNCPSIIDGQGFYIYTTPFQQPAPTLDFTVTLSSASCKQATYTIAFYDTAADGTLIGNAPIYTQSWAGDGVFTTFEAQTTFPTAGYPAGVCVFATVMQSKKLTHYAPTTTVGNPCQNMLLDGSAGGSGFRG